MVSGAIADSAPTPERNVTILNETPALTDRLITQGRALVHAIEALGTIERLDAETDALAYELHGLAEEEIAIVEGHS